METRKRDIKNSIDDAHVLTRGSGFLRTVKRAAVIAPAFSLGVFSFIVCMDMFVLPFYLRAGQEVVVPDFIGSTLPEAREIARFHRLEITHYRAGYRGSPEKGRIVHQIPAQGSIVKPKRQVHVTFSRSDGLVTVPNVIGRNVSEAEWIISAAGLSVGEKLLRVSKGYPSGTVMMQHPRPETEARSHSEVTLYIAR